MRNRVWLFAFALLVLYAGKTWGSDVRVQSVNTTQQAREKVVTGTVSDDMGPVAGATVMVKGTTHGVITDMDGKFTLKLPVGKTLVVSFVGYQDKEIVYKGESELKIFISEDVTQLEEVQVIAYGTTKR